MALVTGGSSGIRLAAAKRFVTEGATVYITGRKQEALDAAVLRLAATLRQFRADSGVVSEHDAALEGVDHDGCLHPALEHLRTVSLRRGFPNGCIDSNEVTITPLLHRLNQFTK